MTRTRSPYQINYVEKVANHKDNYTQSISKLTGYRLTPRDPSYSDQNGMDHLAEAGTPSSDIWVVIRYARAYSDHIPRHPVAACSTARATSSGSSVKCWYHLVNCGGPSVLRYWQDLIMLCSPPMDNCHHLHLLLDPGLMLGHAPRQGCDCTLCGGVHFPLSALSSKPTGIKDAIDIVWNISPPDL